MNESTESMIHLIFLNNQTAAILAHTYYNFLFIAQHKKTQGYLN